MTRATIAVSIPCERWREALPAVAALVRRAVRAALRHGDAETVAGAEVSVALADDAALAMLNRRFRRKSGPTNVLSFPSEPPMLGDVVIAFETTAREAKTLDIPLSDHLAHLCVHGTLHLLGHDHVRARDARIMELLEAAALFRLGIADPYNEGAR